jgi:putative membrane protein
MHLTGIIDAQDFRNRIVAAREALKSQRGGAPAPAADAQGAEQLAALRAIEARLEEIAGLLRQR